MALRTTESFPSKPNRIPTKEQGLWNNTCDVIVMKHRENRKEETNKYD